MKKKLISLLLAMTMLCSSLALPAAAQEPAEAPAPATAQQAEKPAAQPTEEPAATGEQAEPEEKPSTEESAEGKTDELAETVSGDWTYAESSGMAIITKYSGSAANVTIPATLDGLRVNCINGGAFKDNYTLSGITIGSNVQIIRGAAFENCANLSSITIEGNLVDASQGAAGFYTDYSNAPFYKVGAYSDTLSVTFASGVSRVPSYLFATGHDMSYNYYPRVTSVTLASTVTEIGKYAFYNCYKLKNVSMGGVQSVGEKAFYNCYDLTGLGSASNLRTIGKDAFRFCSGIETLNLPSKVTTIEDGAFADLPHLTSLTIPASVTSIGSCSFAQAVMLSNITINGNLADISSSAAMSSLDKNYAPFYAAGSSTTSLKVTFGSGVTRVPAYLFATGNEASSMVYPRITNLQLASTVKEIGKYAFYRCYSISTFNLGGTEIIENKAFQDCTGLKNLYNSHASSLKKIGEEAFRGCTSLKTINVPSNVEEIGANAFEGCTSATTLNIPKKTTKLGDSAFANCTYLTSITINGNLADISSSAASIYGDYNRAPFYAAGANTTSLKVTFGSGVTEIPSYLFATGHAVGDRVFPRITSIQLASTVKEIGKYAFYQCYKLADINLGGTEEIEDKAFYNCTGLKNLYNSSAASLEEIGKEAFRGCTGLKTINIPSKVEEIGANAFEGCTSATTLNIPQKTNKLGASAFANCTSLTSITINGNLADIVSSAASLSSDRNYAPFYAAGANTASLQVMFGANVKRVPAYLFATGHEKGDHLYARITSVTMPEGVSEIGKGAFYNCYLLKNVGLPNSMGFVGENAFYNCKSIVVTPSEPSRDSYTFLGWYTAATGGTKVYSNTGMALKTGKALYSQWKYVSYTVKFNANGGAVSPTSKAYGRNAAFSNSPVPKRTGYTFLGWFTAASGGTQMYSTSKVTKAMTVYAHWGKNCTITFNPNGGTVSPTKKTCGVGGYYGGLPTPVRSGYTFKGWSAGGVTYTSTSKVTGNKTLYAMWAKNCTITFNPNGGTVTPTSRIRPMNDTFGTLPTPTRSGYTFTGWFRNGVQVYSTTKVTGGTALYAHWTKA